MTRSDSVDGGGRTATPTTLVKTLLIDYITKSRLVSRLISTQILIRFSIQSLMPLNYSDSGGNIRKPSPAGIVSPFRSSTLLFCSALDSMLKQVDLR